MQVPDKVRKSVFFILCKDKKEDYKLMGTGLFISVPSEKDKSTNYVYLITAKHVIVDISRYSIDSKVWLRINTKDGGSQLVGTDIRNWKGHPEDTSIDAMVFAWAPDMNVFDYLTIPNSMTATHEIISTKSIGLGDEVFMTGLFINHVGKEKNIPIVRTGNIASMPEEPIKSRYFGNIDAYLIEARSIGGLSGSPVFVHLQGVRMVGGQTTLSAGSELYWLGIMHGHWDLPTSTEDMVVEDSATKEAVNMGIAIVVPAEKILEIINQPYFLNQRR